MSNEFAYRRDIDGLRGLAVLLVIFFHFEISLFSGGYIGVDVFFVISGFVITQLIYKETLSNQTFAFLKFYLRRLRRLFPNVIVVVLLIFIIAYFIFPPQHLERLGGSLVHALANLSNVFFLNESGYFDELAEVKPALHTWSLSLEWQFYFIWPFLYVWLLKNFTNKIISLIIVSLIVSSLLLSFLYLEDQQTVFYLIHFRIFEFLIGAFLVTLMTDSNKEVHFKNDVIFLLGFILIIYASIFFTKDTLFPYYNALVPTIGTALIIFSATSSKYIYKIIDNKVLINIGLISYALYLVHWPIYVFYKYWTFDTLNLFDKFILIAFSFISAILLYKYIEFPIRKGKISKNYSLNKTGLSIILIIIFLSLPLIHTWKNNGWLWRFPKEVLNQLSYKADHFHKYVWKKHKELATKEFSNNGKPKLLVIGDSMAANFINILLESNQLNKFDLVTIPIYKGCKSIFPLSNDIYENFLKSKVDICKKQHTSIVKNELLMQAETVVLGSSWDKWTIPVLKDTIDFLYSKDVKNVAIIGRQHQSITGIKFLAKHGLHINASKKRTLIEKYVPIINKRIQSIDKKFIFIDLLDKICNEKGCERVTKEGFLITYDRSHFTPYGANYLGNIYKESHWMKSLEEGRK